MLQISIGGASPRSPRGCYATELSIILAFTPFELSLQPSTLSFTAQLQSDTMTVECSDGAIHLSCSYAIAGMLCVCVCVYQCCLLVATLVVHKSWRVRMDLGVG